MINLGRHSGKDMPNVHIHPTIIDWILEGISVLLVVLAGVFTMLYYMECATPSNRFWIPLLIMLLMTALFVWSNRAPIRYFNFPVKLTERNYVVQYRIATYFTRIANVLLNVLMCFIMLGEAEEYLGIEAGLFIKWVKLITIVFFLFLIVYFLIASRYR